jgi:pyridoxal phosphate enzyme (YggS family)
MSMEGLVRNPIREGRATSGVILFPADSRAIMATIVNNLQAVKSRIAAAARVAGRNPDDIKLLAVSKTFGADAIRAAVNAGQRAFGESYVQEAVAKIGQLAGLGLEWHFIGPIQSNKTRLIAEHFAWVHSVDRMRIAQRLSEARPPTLAPLQVCIEVNLSGEATKGGVAPGEVDHLARQIAALPGLTLRGLMAIPEPSDDPSFQRCRFAELRSLSERLNDVGLGLDTLSMGMSGDMEAAIMEGATILRIGTAIFGERA